MPGTATLPRLITAARFLLQVTGGSESWGFSELSGISMEVEPHEFIFCDNRGGIVHTKQYGKTKPPTVTLKKPMDEDKALWGWHLAAQAGSPNARLDCTLIAYAAGSPGEQPTDQAKVFEWLLQAAWPGKIELTALKAGATDSPQLTVTFHCDLITVPGASGTPTGAIPGA
jgi:phage tail-like protein